MTDHNPEDLHHALGCVECYNQMPNGIRPHREPELEHIGTDLHRRMEEHFQRYVRENTGRRWGKTEAQEQQNPRLEMREFESKPMPPPISTGKMVEVNEKQPKTAEEMAEQLGVPVDKLGEAIQAQIDYYTRASQKMLEAFVPPKMNRAQRRAAAKRRRRV